MPGYYVETWQPDGAKAEAWETFDVFDAAIEWLEKRKHHDAKRVLRIRGALTVEQERRLSRFGTVERI